MISVRFSEHLKSRDTVTHAYVFGLLHRWGAKMGLFRGRRLKNIVFNKSVTCTVLERHLNNFRVIMMHVSLV
jgi:hypothetical protein